MPIYDYDCTSCGHVFELKKSWSEDPLAMCPLCDAPAHKRFAIPAIVYKGSGFYTTDSRSSSSATSIGGSNGTGKSKSPSSDNGKSEGSGTTEKKESSGTAIKDNSSAGKSTAGKSTDTSN